MGDTLIPGDVWYANFPLEEDHTQTIDRPVIILNIEPLEVLSVKVTKHAPRKKDEFDIPILYWQHAKLRFSSTARISKTISIPKSQFRKKIGPLHPDDLIRVQEAFMEYISSL
ncbi:type II toxin-antitoxin system PemK/MazF family toxin [Pelosinus propionicus]|uniref:PemK-like, MazF-like toxin of type II toxin-antitoxin system n=1 Tax=Pelosinus propionicus DSM 13327 TaxID=1123291 RepID=A0A1I4QEZ7_9FIRM|nr:type II toxin-antitoxin system PemK/MazF family toxin [Pelosinus propionicus]SFM38356.1 PemK-like, MazF-like toxin of type II toxin-antitoxin system [Pelosinus propionicus DSM 13327]